MKKLVVFASALAAGMVMASSVSSTQTFGVLKITSNLQQTVISVPWVAAGTGSAVKVKDFVKTTGLNDGTLLYKYDDGTFKAWILNNGAWEGLTVVTDENDEFGGKKVSKGGDDTLSQQDAIIIVRQAGNTSGDIYLYGQYSDASDLTYTIDRSAGATLVSPVNTTGSTISLNSLNWTAAPTNGDMIKLHDSAGYAATFVYDGSQSAGQRWGVMEDGEWNYGAAVVRAGMGFWYTPVSTNTTGSVAFKVGNN